MEEKRRASVLQQQSSKLRYKVHVAEHTKYISFLSERYRVQNIYAGSINVGPPIAARYLYADSMHVTPPMAGNIQAVPSTEPFRI